MYIDEKYLKKLLAVIEEYKNQYGDQIYLKYFPITIEETKKENDVNNNQIQIYEFIENQNLINRFAKIFFNRIDVYAKLWIKQDKSGYSFVCNNEWNPKLCNKLKGLTCKTCENKQYTKLTISTLSKHLNEDLVLGTYTINQNSSTKFMVFDFDEEDWKQEVILLKQEFDKLGVFSYIEISKSSNGAHLWIFFESNKKAQLVRTFAKVLMAKILDNNPSFNFNSFDRMFPTQNEINQNGLGNLICLPYSKKYLTTNSHCFVDDNWNPLTLNQFMDKLVLNTDFHINKMLENHKQEIDNLLKEDKRIVSSNCVKFIRSSELIFDLDKLDSSIIKFLRKISSLYNPEYFKKERMRMSTYNTPFIIDCTRIIDSKIYVPRGLEQQIINKFKEAKIQYEIKTQYNKTNKIKISDNIQLKNNQQVSFLDLLKNNIGILVAPTGFGKTLVGLKLISHFKVNTLILVNTLMIANQWKNQILKFLNISEDEINLNTKQMKSINIRTIQSFNDENQLLEQTKKINLLLVDECHHFASYSYEKILRKINAKYVYGFSATPKRSDGLDKILTMLMGSLVYANQHESPIKKSVLIKNTDFSVDSKQELSLLDYNELIFKDEVRNDLLANDALDALKNDKVVLLIVEWKKHLDILYDKLVNKNFNLVILHGQLTTNELKIQMQKLKISGPKIILATGKYIGEGVDIPDIDFLIIGFPFKWSGKLEQYVGRLRINDLKKELTIIDYLDKNIAVYFKMFSSRIRTYKNLGFEINDNLNLNNKMLYFNDEKIKAIDNDLIQAKYVISSVNLNRFNKNENTYIQYIYHNELKFLIIDRKIIWLFTNEISYRLNNLYLIEEILSITT